MKTLLKTLTFLAAMGFASVAIAQTANQTTTPQTWGPGWRQEQMNRAAQDGTFIPCPGRGPGRGQGVGMWGGGPGPGRGGMMAAAVGPDGKIDPSKLPVGCPVRNQLTK